ncbi:MAG TPA: sorbosone dehydrogenase family protein [Stellaceae bacterium]|nr:sorbosone dehydrogenase family protein [Stellaceae bacterium]
MRATIVAAFLLAATVPATNGNAQGAVAPPILLNGKAAYGDWRSDAPGTRRRLSTDALPAPYASRSASNSPAVVAVPANATLNVPDGFTVRRFAAGMEAPRTIRIAPNGDIFIAESGAGRIRVMRAADGAASPAQSTIFADDLSAPFGIAFYPPGTDPQFLYVANTDSVVRFAYRNGDLRARGAPQTIVPRLPEGGHWTRDLVFSSDGRRMFVSVGSASNVAQGLPAKSPEEIRAWETANGLGAAWGGENRRADVLAFAPDGSTERRFATGLRNCSALAVQPRSGALWCATNERDGVGDDLPPDYATRVGEGRFYGWPWYYIGDHEDPRHKGERPDLADKVTVPDVLLQPHSAPLGIAFYDAPDGATAGFPDAYRGDAFVALHGSWNRSKRTGYKIVRLLLKDGVPSGAYEDFLTGFVLDDNNVWGRPVGVAVAHDGALLISEDGNGTIWRIAYKR